MVRASVIRALSIAPVAQERVEQRGDGLVRITLKKAYTDGTIAVDMDPLSLRCRLATSVPPSRLHTIRYAGVLAPASPWRSRLAPHPPQAAAASDEPGGPDHAGATAPGGSSWRAPSTTVSTASHTGEVTGPVRVTHPFHPLHGQELEVLAQRVQWGEGRVFYRDPQGHRASMPVGWTSLVAPDPYLTVGAARSRFRLQDLIDLAALLAGIGR